MFLLLAIGRFSVSFGGIIISIRCEDAHSFAKTPLKAAQAPLAAASTNHLRARIDGVGGGSLGGSDSGGMLEGRRGSTWVSMLDRGAMVFAEGWLLRAVRRMG